MRKFLSALASAALTTVLALPPPAVAQTEDPGCANLARDYENASKDLAYNAVQNILDNSAFRAAARNSEDAGTIEKARITLQLMAGKSCKTPDSAPSATRYFDAALQCETDRAKGGLGALYGTVPTPASCSTETWQPKAQ